MTTYALRSASPAKTRAEVVVVGVLKGKRKLALAPGAEDVAAAYGRKLDPMLSSLGVKGGEGELVRVPSGGAVNSPMLLFVGLGSDPTPRAVRRAAGVAARAVGNATSVALALPADSPVLVRAATEGFILGGYTFTGSKKPTRDAPDAAATVTVLSPGARRSEVIAEFEAAQVIAEATARARDWINVPPGDFTPPLFAEAVAAQHRAERKTLPKGTRLTLTVHDEEALAELGCGGILAVGLGSTAAPRLVKLDYHPADARGHVAVVGKGVTFDSGGYTLKPGSSMADMKQDMSGAAAALQATFAIARLGLPVRVTTWAPMAENMVSGSAYRPGDVVTTRNGTTVEVRNTDAEGRMILSDALALAAEDGPDVIVDIATLTAHLAAALLERVGAVMGSDEIVAEMLAASTRSDEDLWPMPIPDEMVERVRASPIADLLQHDWVRWGGGLYAGAFLREFTADLPWAHLDVAGPAFNSGSPWGHVPGGGVGFGVATLVEFARGRAERVDD